jgi:hypothetical protein
VKNLALALVLLGAAACRSPKPAPLAPVVAPEAVKMPMYDKPHAALQSLLLAPLGDDRSVGTLKVEFGGKSLSAKLDLRIRSEPEPILWMDVADPLIGLKIGRARIYQDSVQGYIRLYRQYVNEPLTRLRSMGIDVKTEDARRLVLGLPLAVPVKWSDAKWSVVDSALVMSLTEQRGTYEVLVEVALDLGSSNRLVWQRLTSKGEELLVRYSGNGSWIAEVPKQSVRAEFRVNQHTTGEVLSFPFELPSDYARTSF